jgi:hypothetical protein
LKPVKQATALAQMQVFRRSQLTARPELMFWKKELTFDGCKAACQEDDRCIGASLYRRSGVCVAFSAVDDRNPNVDTDSLAKFQEVP